MAKQPEVFHRRYCMIPPMCTSANRIGFWLLPGPVIRIAVSLTLLMLAPQGVSADSERLELEQSRLQSIQVKISSLQKELGAKSAQQSQLQRQLGSIEKRLNHRHRALRDLQAQLSISRKELKSLKSRQTRLYSDLNQQQEKLIAQLRTAYFMGNQGQLKMLLSQQDPSALSRTLRYFDYLNRARLTIIDSTENTLAEIELNRIEIEKQNSRLASLTSSSKREFEKINTIRNERQTVLSNINRDIKNSRNSVAALKQDEVRVQELIATLSGIFSDIPPETSSLPFIEFKGRLPWPVKGKTLNAFGDSRAQGDLNWQGIQIAAPGGRKVRAISHGRIAFADWIPVFGLILLIDHSDGYMTLYAHNQSLYKETGDWVNAGEVVSVVGASGGREREMLYFEIRHNGKPLDPASWCTAKRS